MTGLLGIGGLSERFDLSERLDLSGKSVSSEKPRPSCWACLSDVSSNSDGVVKGLVSVMRQHFETTERAGKKRKSWE